MRLKRDITCRLTAIKRVSGWISGEMILLSFLLNNSGPYLLSVRMCSVYYHTHLQTHSTHCLCHTISLSLPLSLALPLTLTLILSLTHTPHHELTLSEIISMLHSHSFSLPIPFSLSGLHEIGTHVVRPFFLPPRVKLLDTLQGKY